MTVDWLDSGERKKNEAFFRFAEKNISREAAEKRAKVR